MVSRTEGSNINDSLICENASAEGPEGEVTVDIVMSHHLQETSFTKEAYKKVYQRLHEITQRVKPFMTGTAEQIKHILANFSSYQFFIGENMNPDGMVALLDYHKDFMIFFKDGLEMEKC
uniref:Translationally-controlled tumor protein n=1 Tax=Cricetulus griseus TaxID=10029 RepID=A0A8C2MFQ8_CRIGR